MVLRDVNAGLFKVKIEVGDHFEVKKKDYYIILREMTSEEGMSLPPDITLKKKDDQKTFKELTDEEAQTLKRNEAVFALIPKLIIEHNFDVLEGPEPKEDEKDTRVDVHASVDEVWKWITSRPKCMAYVFKQWTKSLPLQEEKKEQLEK